eukprot:Skav235212  [mRNA]  locus=scaffold3995:5284:8806:+ [translate_table: standard]
MAQAPCRAGGSVAAARRAQTAEETEESRGSFWRQRARRFQVDAHFPALVTQELLPGWHMVNPDDEDEYDTKQQPPELDYLGFSQTLLKSTASCDAKFDKKKLKSEDEDKFRVLTLAAVAGFARTQKYQSVSFGGGEALDDVMKLEDIEGMSNGKPAGQLAVEDAELTVGLTMDLVVAVPPEPEEPGQIWAQQF